jgi:hypothetical protein
VYDVSACGLIYPISEERWEAKGLGTSSGVVADAFSQGRREIPFYVLFIKMPSEGKGFQRSFQESCKVFQTVLMELVGLSEASWPGGRMLIA